MIDAKALEAELCEAVMSLKAVQESVEKRAVEMCVLAADLQTVHGDWVLAPILTAKVNALRALVDLGSAV